MRDKATEVDATSGSAWWLADDTGYRAEILGLILALTNQFLSQLELPVRDAILGNAGKIISFRLGLADAEVLEKEFYPEFNATDLVNLPNYSVYLKLMVDGVVSRPFSAITLPSSNTLSTNHRTLTN